ncbi:MAG: NERD domain-containing protein [Erysipelotrichaceae bacterium]|nr:NERD domain-containing protein [Erysipelotrichaceae bacterium]
MIGLFVTVAIKGKWKAALPFIIALFVFCGVAMFFSPLMSFIKSFEEIISLSDLESLGTDKPLLSVLVLALFFGSIIFAFVSTATKKKRDKRKIQDEFKKQENNRIYEYHNSEYYKQTRIPYEYLLNDRGKMGEFLIYLSLKNKVSENSRFLFNLYLPKDNGETSEIDVLLIDSTGLYVFESKNYNGWIFGSPTMLKWTQEFGNKEKHRFYNPILQNKKHCEVLSSTIGISRQTIFSFIVFGDDCTFRTELNDTKEYRILFMQELPIDVPQIIASKPQVLSSDDIQSIFNQLYPFTQVSDEVKEKHKEDILEEYVN